jgi:hypothetical protein
MSEPGFEELQRLWQAPSPVLAPARKIILRQRRRRWLSRLYLGLEIVLTIVGIPLMIWVALQPRQLWFGLGMLVTILIAAGVSLWARSLPKAREDDPLLASMEQGVRRARIGVRLGYASLWGIVAGMIVVGAFAFFWPSGPELSVPQARRMIVAFGLCSIFFALFAAGTLVYLVARSRELAQMEAARSALGRAPGEG